jgi:hypothetical protein
MQHQFSSSRPRNRRFSPYFISTLRSFSHPPSLSPARKPPPKHNKTDESDRADTHPTDIRKRTYGWITDSFERTLGRRAGEMKSLCKEQQRQQQREKISQKTHEKRKEKH